MDGTDSTAVFADLSEVGEQVPYDIESLCPNCQENGSTKLMCVRIPYYRQVIVMSFSCEHCGYRNNELQSAEAVQEHGTEIVLHVKEPIDLNRQLVKSEYAQIEIPELELTIPSLSQPGEITTVEGIVQRVKSGLLQDQEKRKILDPDSAAKIDEFILKIDDLLASRQTFTLKLRDASGNCYIQNPNPFHVDPRCITVHYARSLMENKMLGLADDNQEEEEPAPEWKSFEDAKREVLRFPTDCPNCGTPTETCMKPTDIPYFSTVIIMSTTCDVCGLRTNEVKSCGAIRDKGCKLTVSVEEEQGRFFFGDSASTDEKKNVESFFEKFDEVLRLQRKIHVVLDDPAGNSYVQSLSGPFEDPRLTKEFYERTYEQNDELGLNDMKTENYGELDTVIEEVEVENDSANG